MNPPRKSGDPIHAPDGAANADTVKHSLAGPPKYRQIYQDLHTAIKEGHLRAGDRLPSEADLGKRYCTSRITIAKAVNELQAQGLVSRRPGSGTHVLAQQQTAGHVFGLLIPDLGRTEIFEPICHGMMQSPLSKAHSLLWGHSMSSASEQEKEAEHLCHQYITQKVAGVFFAPLEFTPAKDVVNSRIVSSLERSGIQIVLLDRCYAPAPTRSKFDLVGIDNRRAGALITQHLLRHGAKRIAFIARPLSASTVVRTHRRLSRSTLRGRDRANTGSRSSRRSGRPRLSAEGPQRVPARRHRLRERLHRCPHYGESHRKGNPGARRHSRRRSG